MGARTIGQARENDPKNAKNARKNKVSIGKSEKHEKAKFARIGWPGLPEQR